MMYKYIGNIPPSESTTINTKQFGNQSIHNFHQVNLLHDQHR